MRDPRTGNTALLIDYDLYDHASLRFTFLGIDRVFDVFGQIAHQTFGSTGVFRHFFCILENSIRCICSCVFVSGIRYYDNFVQFAVFYFFRFRFAQFEEDGNGITDTYFFSSLSAGSPFRHGR